MAPKKSRVTPRVALRFSSRALSRARAFPPLFLLTRGDPRPSTCVISAGISLFLCSSFVAHALPASICTLISPIHLQLVGSLLFICSASKSLMTVW